jgi:hypothetical protein
LKEIQMKRDKKQLITNGATALSGAPEAVTDEENGATAPETRENVIEFPKPAEPEPVPQAGRRTPSAFDCG